VNIDIYSQIKFGDADGLRQFFGAHRFVHQETASALYTQYGVQQSTFGVSNSLAEEQWAEKMRQKKHGEMPQALKDWLAIHAVIHNQTYVTLGASADSVPDLSTVDFSDEQAFNDWMSSHQQMHDYEYSQLGLT